MSKIFTRPHLPIYPGGEPVDFTEQSAGGAHELALGIYAIETTQRYVYGTRLITWDGRVYKYCNAVAQVYSYSGAFALENAALSWTSNAVVANVGDRQQTVAVGSRTLDDLAGAFLMTNDASATTTTILQGIIGNEVSISTTTIIYTDFPIPFTTTTSDYHEVFENPYRETSESVGSGTCAIICVPAISAAATYKYWGQTWGPAYVSPANNSLDDPAIEERQVYFSVAGTEAKLVEAAVNTGGSEAQHAGFILNGDTASGGNIAGPLIMLQITI